MAITITLELDGTATGNYTVGKVWSHVPTHPSFVILAHGYLNDAVGVFPATATWNGVTVNRILLANAFVPANGSLAIYYADSDDVAAMVEDTSGVSYGTTLAVAYEITCGIIECENMQDTLIDSDVVDGGYDPREITLTTEAGDIVIMIAAERGDQGGMSLGTGMTAFDTLDSSSNGLDEANVRIDTITATGSFTTADVAGDADENSWVAAIAIRESGGGGEPGGGEQLLLLHAHGEL